MAVTAMAGVRGDLERREPEVAVPVRVDLAGPLAGYHVLVNVDDLDCGWLEDIQSGRMATILDRLSTLLVGGDLPHGVERAGLRRLKPDQLRAIVDGCDGLFLVPKAT